jgi:hypothetical protein
MAHIAIETLYNNTLSLGSAVGVVTGYGLDYREAGVRVPVWSRIFAFLYRSDRLCVPHNLLFNGYRGFFPRG